MLAGYDDDLARESTRSINGLRSLLLQIHPALERVFAGTRLTNKLSLDLLARYGGPTGLAKAGPAGVMAWARKTKHRGIDTLVDDVFTTLAQQTVTVIGTAAVETVVPPPSRNRSRTSTPSAPSSPSRSRGCLMTSLFATS